jgi:hypothetical protein
LLPFNASADSIDDATGDAGYDALKLQVEMLQRQLQQIQETLKQYEQQTVTKEEVQEIRQEVAEVATLQSEWKNTDSVVHLAGYGAVTYSDSDGKDDGEDVNGAFTGVQFNPIFHYQYKDLLMLESELELEVEEDGSTEIELEYLTVDLFLNDYLAAIAGKFLSPLGQFRQNLHPSWINKLPTAPPGFGHDEAAPVSEVGLQARGGFPVGGNNRFANYAVYVGNGPILEIEDGEIEAIEAEGRTSNDDDKFVFGGRIGLLPIPMLEVGLSAATGKVAGEDEPSATRDYDVYGADAAWKWNNLGLRGEYIKQKVGSKSSSEAPDSADWETWYAQVAYRLMPTNWEGVVRYTDYDSPHDSVDQKQWALGGNYLFSPNAMAKIAYNFNDGESGTVAGEDGYQLQFAYGF